MPELKKVLILGGTHEASELARRMVSELGEKAQPILSLAGLVDPGRAHSCPVRTGGFGGIDGMVAYLKTENITMVIDATHPFSERISTNAYCACQRAEVPRLMLIRPPWRLFARDRWMELDSLEEVAKALPAFARKVLLTVGKRHLGAFSEVEGVHFVVRLIAPPDEPLPLKDCTVVVGPPPHSQEEEARLIREHVIDTLVSRNSGGEVGGAKLEAAREAGIKIVLVARPPEEPGPVAETVDAAMGWLAEQL